MVVARYCFSVPLTRRDQDTLLRNRSMYVESLSGPLRTDERHWTLQQIRFINLLLTLPLR